MKKQHVHRGKVPNRKMVEDPNRVFRKKVLTLSLVLVVGLPLLFSRLQFEKEVSAAVSDIAPQVIAVEEKRQERPQAAKKVPQQMEAKWSRYYEQGHAQSIRSVVRSSDGYLLTGNGQSNNVYVMEIDVNGNELWYRNLLGTNGAPTVGIETPDGYFVSVMRTVFATDGKLSGDLYKIDKREKKIVNRVPYALNAMVPFDGGCIASGNNNVLYRFDSNGNKVWEKKIERGEYTILKHTTKAGTQRYRTHRGEIEKIIRTSDGNFVGIGGIITKKENVRTPWLFKFDASGRMLFETHVRDLEANVHDVIETSDGSFIVNGSGYRRNLLVLKFSSKGELLWQRRYTKSGEGSASGWGAAEYDGGYILANQTYSKHSYGVANVHLMKIDREGKKVWEKGFVRPEDHDHLRHIIPTPDGGYLLGGNSWKFRSQKPGFSAWLVKADATMKMDGNLFPIRNIHRVDEVF